MGLVGVKDPLGLAVDRRGHVFLADQEVGNVTEFAAGATGPQKPISTLNVPNGTPDHLKVDRSDRLYVDGGYQTIGVSAKGVQGNDPPISIIAKYHKSEGIVDYDITPSGTLYVLDWSIGAAI